MILTRLKKGKNAFAVNLTLGKLMAIQRALETCQKHNVLSPIEEETLNEMKVWNLNAIDSFGDTHVYNKSVYGV